MKKVIKLSKNPVDFNFISVIIFSILILVLVFMNILSCLFQKMEESMIDPRLICQACAQRSDFIYLNFGIKYPLIIMVVSILSGIMMRKVYSVNNKKRLFFYRIIFTISYIYMLGSILIYSYIYIIDLRFFSLPQNIFLIIIDIYFVVVLIKSTVNTYSKRIINCGGVISEKKNECKGNI